jgi:outer membrane lipoprotein SlyB
LKALRLIPIVGLTILAGCANDPIVDKRGVSEAKYQKDLAECRSYAAQANTAGEVVEGAAIGAAVGAAVGAVVGNSDSAKRGAGAGAVTGGAQGGLRAEERKDRVLQRCLKGRGYRVLG